MGDDFRVTFNGGMSDKHKLPAYAAGQSLTGIARSVMIPLMYLSEGRVRHRKLTHPGFDLNLLATKPGSFQSVYEFATRPEMMFAWGYLADVGKDVAKDLVVDFVKSVINLCVGKSATKSIENLETRDKVPVGDIQALVDAIEPAMREAHMTIGNGASNIIIIKGDKSVVQLNANTKAFVMGSEDDDEIREKEFSIGSFNANTGNGRAFDYDEKRTIPFILDGSADRRSIDAILASLLKYTQVRRLNEEQSSRVRLKYTTVIAPDGRVKKLKISRAREGQT